MIRATKRTSDQCYETEEFHEILEPIDVDRPYNALLMANIRQTECDFFNDISDEIIDSPKQLRDYYIYSVLNHKTVCIRGSFKITHQMLNDKFPHGHTLSFVMGATYMVPLAIDLDHLICDKQHNCPTTAAHLFSKLEDVYFEVAKFLDLKVDFAKGCYIETRECGLHVYFGIRVSIVVYDFLLTHLTETLSVHGYLFDRVSNMPLPYSTKRIGARYGPFNNHVAKLCDVVSDKAKMYDMKIFSSLNLDDTGKLIVSRNQCVTSEQGEIEDEWLELETGSATEILYTPHEIQIFAVPQNEIDPPATIRRFTGKNVTTSNANLKQYLTARGGVVENVHLSIEMGDVAACVSDAIEKLARQISKTLGLPLRGSGAACFYHIYSLMLAPGSSGGYSVYVICAFVNYIATSCRMSVDSAVAILGVLLSKCKSNNSIATSNIQRNFDSLEKHNAFHRCCCIFSEYIYILRYLSVMEYYKRQNHDTFQEVLTRVITDEIDDTSTLDTIKFKLINIILPYFFPTVRTSRSSGDCYLYDMCRFVHVPCIADGIKVMQIGVFLVLKGVLHRHYKRLGIKKGDISEDIMQIWLQYAARMPTKTLKFGKYNFFFNTNFGYFNNLSGLYMTNVPFLYFLPKLQCKKFATIPPNLLITPQDSVTIEELNESLAGAYDSNQLTMHTLANSGDDMFHLFVMLPGLLNFRNITVFSMDTCEKLMRDIFNRTNGSISKLLYHFKCVMVRYPVNVADSACLAWLFDSVDISGRTIEVGLSEKCSTRAIDPKKFVNDAAINQDFAIDYTIDSGTEIVQSILNNYPTLNITTRSFVCSYAYAVFCSYGPFVLKETLFVHRYLDISTALTQLTDKSLACVDAAEADVEPNRWFVSGSRFTHEMYHPRTNINIERALWLCFGDLSADIQQAIGCIYKMFGCSTSVVTDFLCHFSLLYQPWNENRMFVWLRGPAACGKSLITTTLTNSHGDSHCPIKSKLKPSSDTENASPMLMSAITAYFTPIKEAKYVDDDTIKMITGQDAISLRGLYSSVVCVEPVSFVMCISNKFPNMKADYAIKTRLVVFRMSYSFHDITRVTNDEENQLVLFSRQKNISVGLDGGLFDIGLSNLLYAAFCFYRNGTGFVVPKITNTESIEEQAAFMVQNNIAYKIMDAIGVKEGKINEITYDCLKERVECHINHQHTVGIAKKNSIPTFTEFIDEFNDLFQPCIFRGSKISHIFVCLLIFITF
ncbi:MAG: hypothetical protein MUO31_07570 [Thermodesulfovibrionales bacterium]|nr:hypothetical protein [Thermodesulfovibrionales bacterium]